MLSPDAALLTLPPDAALPMLLQLLRLGAACGLDRPYTKNTWVGKRMRMTDHMTT